MSKFVLTRQTADALKGLIRGQHDGGIEGAGFMPGVFVPGDAASSTAKVIYVSGPEHSTIEGVYWSSVRPFDWTAYEFTTVGAVNCWAYDVLGTHVNSGYYIGVLIGQLEGLELYVIHSPAKAIGPVGDDETGTTYSLTNHPYWLFDYDSGFRFAVEGSDPYDNLITSITPATPTQAGIVSTGSQTFSAGKTFTDDLTARSLTGSANLTVMGIGGANAYIGPDPNIAGGKGLSFWSSTLNTTTIASDQLWSEAVSPYGQYNMTIEFCQDGSLYGFPCLMFNRVRQIISPPSPVPYYDTTFCLGINGDTGAWHPDPAAMIQVKGGLVTNIDSDLANGIIDGGEWS